MDFYEKLASSGLDSTDAECLCIEALTAAQTKMEGFDFLPSMKFRYIDPRNGKLMQSNLLEPFARFRYLEMPPKTFPTTTTKKPPRYIQPPHTYPMAYYPSNIQWPIILKDANQPLIITEGELKAAKGCKEGFPTIGLGGVHSFQALKRGILWLPSLTYPHWPKRSVYICFDSDFKTNAHVCKALMQLAEALIRRGAFAYLVVLPSLPEMEKVGMDDYLTFAGPSANEMFGRLLADAEPLGIVRQLFDYNNQYVYVRNPGFIVDMRTNMKLTPQSFKDHEATHVIPERAIKKGEISYKLVPAAPQWLRWPLRNEAAGIVYEPGKPRYTEEGNYNIWAGWGVQPAHGDPAPFLRLVDYLFTGAEKGMKEWFLRWCAYPLQHPGAKLATCVVIFGLQQGTGKSTLGYTLGRIYGENFTEISQPELLSSFNEWAEGKQFVMGDDVTGSDQRKHMDHLKKLITQENLRINIKFIPSYSIRDHINYLLTSNHPDALYLPNSDRRFFIHEVVVEPLDAEFYSAYNQWLAEGGDSVIFNYLLKYPLEDFNPAAPAPVTAAKANMTHLTRSELEAWVDLLWRYPDMILKNDINLTFGRDIASAQELLIFYDPDGRKGVTAQGLGRAMAKRGFRQVNGGNIVRTSFAASRYFIVRNREFWVAKTLQEVVDYLEKFVGAMPVKRKY